VELPLTHPELYQQIGISFIELNWIEFEFEFELNYVVLCL
jgi:hypothetical protein